MPKNLPLLGTKQQRQIPPKLEKLLNNFCEDLKQQQRSSRTQIIYRDILQRYFSHASLESDSLTSGSIRRFMREASNKISKSTQAQWTSALQSFLHWASKEKIHLDPTLKREINRPRTPKKLIQIFNEDDLAPLLECINSRTPQEQLLFELLYGSALRVSEAVAIQWKNVDLQSQQIKILGKGKKWRQIPLSPKATALLNTDKGARSPTGNDSIWDFQASSNIFYQWVRKWSQLAGFDEAGIRLHPHKFRHSLATHLLRRGAKLPQIQKLLGHSLLSTTERYTHLNPEDLIKIYDKAFPKMEKIR